MVVLSPSQLWDRTEFLSPGMEFEFLENQSTIELNETAVSFVQ